MELPSPVLWEPSADERRVRAAADLWRSFAAHLECTLADLTGTVRRVTSTAEGAAVDAVATYWTGLTGAEEVHLDELSTSCRALADALDAYADALADTRRQLLELAATLAAAVAVGVAMTWATAGLSAAASASAVTAATVQATGLAAVLATRAGTIARVVGLHAGVGALEGLATYAIVEPLRIATFHPNDDPFGSYEGAEIVAAAAGGAVIPGWRAARAVRGAGTGAVPAPPMITKGGALLDELRRNGVRHDPSNVVEVRRLKDGSIAFLERGDAQSGLVHIVNRHAEDFLGVGISADEVPGLVMDALAAGRQVGTQGRSRGIFELVVRDRTHRIAVEVGSNGYVVSANPRSMP